MNTPKNTLFRLLDAWKDGDVETYVACFADEFESSHPLGQTRDLNHIRKEIVRTLEHWTDREYRVLSCISEGDLIALEYAMTMKGLDHGFSGRIELPGLVMATIRSRRPHCSLPRRV